MLDFKNIDAAKAKMNISKDEFCTKIKEFGGDCKCSPERIVISLHNADSVGMLLCLFEEDAKSVMVGAKAAKNALGAKSILVVLPEGKENLEGAINEGAAFVDEKVEFVYGLCVKREYEEDLILHPLTLCKLAMDLAGEDTEFAIVKVDDNAPKKVEYCTSISALAGDFKAVRIGNHIFGSAHKDAIIDEYFPIENGVITTISSEECIVKAASDIIHEMRTRSCGRCVYCREGLAQIDTVLADIIASRPRPNDLDFIAEIVEAMTKYSNCSLGKTAGGAVTGLLAEFMDEAKEHMQKSCRTLKCESMVHYYIDPKVCKGDASCNNACKYEAITGGKDFVNIIDDFDCKKCGECLNACPNGAIKVATGKVNVNIPENPIPLKAGLLSGDEDDEMFIPPLGKRPRPRRRKKL